MDLTYFFSDFASSRGGKINLVQISDVFFPLLSLFRLYIEKFGVGGKFTPPLNNIGLKKITNSHIELIKIVPLFRDL